MTDKEPRHHISRYNDMMRYEAQRGESQLIFVIDTLSIMLHCRKNGAFYPIWMRLYLMPLVLRIDLVPQYDGWVYIQLYRANKEHKEEAAIIF